VSAALYAHRLFLRAGLAIANVFAWIFVFEYFSALAGDIARGLAATALLYALTQIIVIVATPMSAAHLRRGTKHSMIWGVVCAAGAFVYLGATLAGFFTLDTGMAFGWGMAAYAVLLGTYRALYWVPYKLHATQDHERHHMRAYLEVLVALMPLFAGMTLEMLPAAQLHVLFGAAALIVLSALPILFMQDTRERYSWSYVYTFVQLFRSKNTGFVLQAILEGIQGAALFLAWPIAIFIILGWSYAGLGVVFSLTLLFILLLRRVYRWVLARYQLENSVAVQSTLNITAWISRLAAGTPIGIVFADVYSHTVAPVRGVHADAFTFEQMGDRGAFVDEYTALKEIGLAFGRIMLCVLLFFLPFVFILPIVLTIALLVAAVASGISAVIAKRMPVAAY